MTVKEDVEDLQRKATMLEKEEDIEKAVELYKEVAQRYKIINEKLEDLNEEIETVHKTVEQDTVL